MEFIWYNPQNKSYQAGTQVEFDVQKAASSNPEDMVVLYELDELTRKVASKIVSELNSARVEVRV